MNVSWTIRGAMLFGRTWWSRMRWWSAPDAPGRPRRVNGGERDDRVGGGGAEGGGDADRQQHGRKRHEGVQGRDQPDVEPPEVARGRAQQRARHPRQHHHAEPDLEREARPADDAAEEVAAEVVGAEREGGAGRGEAV